MGSIHRLAFHRAVGIAVAAVLLADTGRALAAYVDPETPNTTSTSVPGSESTVNYTVGNISATANEYSGGSTAESEPTYGGYFDSAISSSDLVENGQSSVTAVTATDVAGGNISYINDGSGDGGSVNHYTYFNYDTGTHTIIFSLNTSLTPLGYDLSSIATYAGYDSNSAFADQDFTLEYSTVASPTTFISLGRFVVGSGTNSVAGNPDATTQLLLEPTVGSSLATGVADIEFIYNTSNPGSPAGNPAGVGPVILGEIDAFGSPIAAPEPASVGFLTIAAAGLFLKRRRRSTGR